VALALTLLVVGGISLVNALTSESTAPSPSPPAPSVTGERSTRASSDTSTAPPALQIDVIGNRPAQVLVKEPGADGTILQNGPLNPGETRRYDQGPLDVVVYNDSSLVEVRIYGEVQKDSNGGRGEWEVPSQ
jgi:hypothetical protein